MKSLKPFSRLALSLTLILVLVAVQQISSAHFDVEQGDASDGACVKLKNGFGRALSSICSPGRLFCACVCTTVLLVVAAITVPIVLIDRDPYPCSRYLPNANHIGAYELIEWDHKDYSLYPSSRRNRFYDIDVDKFDASSYDVIEKRPFPALRKALGKFGIFKFDSSNDHPAFRFTAPEDYHGLGPVSAELEPSNQISLDGNGHHLLSDENILDPEWKRTMTMKDQGDAKPFAVIIKRKNSYYGRRYHKICIREDKRDDEGQKRKDALFMGLGAMASRRFQKNAEAKATTGSKKSLQIAPATAPSTEDTVPPTHN
jgi:hypothetical protein